MITRQHKTSTRVLLPPKGATPEQCGPLAVTDTVIDDVPHVASFWYPDDAELAALNAGKGVCVCIEGLTHPPIFVGVEL